MAVLAVFGFLLLGSLAVALMIGLFLKVGEWVWGFMS